MNLLALSLRLPPSLLHKPAHRSPPSRSDPRRSASPGSLLLLWLLRWLALLCFVLPRLPWPEWPLSLAPRTRLPARTSVLLRLRPLRLRLRRPSPPTTPQQLAPSLLLHQRPTAPSGGAHLLLAAFTAQMAWRRTWH